MENASLALRMAGGVLIALLIVGFFISVMVIINDNQQKKQDEEDLRQVTLFNESYSSFENRIITGYQMLSLINKAIDYNTRMTTEYGNGGAEFVPIHIYTELDTVSEDGHKMLPGQESRSESRNTHKNNYIDLNDYYIKRYSKFGTSTKDKDNQNDFKNMYFVWEKTERISSEAKDAKGQRLGNVDGVGQIYEMYFREYVK